MKIGIFGDSFSDPTYVNNDYKSWVCLLAQQHSVTNFSKVGSSLWWSYNIFKKERLNFDQTIFVITFPGRLYIESLDSHINARAEHWPVIDKINLGEVYYKYLFSTEREFDFHYLMTKDIIGKSIVIPAFEESIEKLDGHSLCYIADIEELGYFNKKPNGRLDLRKCHLTKENNLMVFEKILNSLNKSSSIITFNKLDFVQPTDHWNRYWK
jgi:hypothetical protein